MLSTLVLRRVLPVLFLVVLSLSAACPGASIYGSGPVNATMGQTQKIDLAGDSIGAWDDFSFGVNAFMAGFMFNVDSYVGDASNPGDALVSADPPLGLDAPIDGSLAFAQSQVLLHSFSSDGLPVDNGAGIVGIGGPWAFEREGYLGLRLENSGHVYYGWARAGVDQGSVTIYEWAFQNELNTPILTGDVPEPACLSLLALSGMAFLRRRQG
jgi:hypothetical protein